jgi:hypothetical protein
VNIESCTAFGWIIHRVSADAGERLNLEVRREVDPRRMSAQTLYTKGRLSGFYASEPERAALTRVPGFANDMLPNPLPPLTLEMTADEDSEWWCISAPANKKLPSVSFIRIQPGESQVMQAGSLVLVCEGSALFGAKQVVGPLSVRVTDQVSVEVPASAGSMYAMLFDCEKD